MALIDCPECTHKISDRAAYCPNCGYPLKESKERPRPDLPFLDPLAELAAVAEELAAAVHRTLRREGGEEKKPAGEEKKDKPG
jgi:predicted amidophosphoribosyltransferase